MVPKGKVTLFIFSTLMTVSCSSAQVQSYNQSLQDFKFRLNNPSDPEQISNVYFSIIPNPYEAGHLVDSLGAWTFDSLNCSLAASKRSPAQSEFKNKCVPFDDSRGD